MPSSHLSLHYHLIFSTKHREPLIAPALAVRLYDDIGGIVRGAEGVLLAAGGMPDHVHLLVGLGATRALADVLRDVKAGSSKWIHDTFPESSGFRWQTGYGAFVVSHSLLDVVREYIRNQEEHHRSRTFQEEYILFLRRHRIDYDERYVWE
jgi:putative transposase